MKTRPGPLVALPNALSVATAGDSCGVCAAAADATRNSAKTIGDPFFSLPSLRRRGEIKKRNLTQSRLQRNRDADPAVRAIASALALMRGREDGRPHRV